MQREYETVTERPVLAVLHRRFRRRPEREIVHHVVDVVVADLAVQAQRGGQLTDETHPVQLRIDIADIHRQRRCARVLGIERSREGLELVVVVAVRVTGVEAIARQL